MSSVTTDFSTHALMRHVSSAPADSSGALVIRLGSIAHNWRNLSEYVKPATCAAVVKADCYGLGAERVIPALRDAGCNVFFVATYKEAQQARQLAPKSTVFILDGLMPNGAELIDTDIAWPVISDLDEIRQWAKRGQMQNKRLPCALQIDSGLNRLGLSGRDVQQVAKEGHLLSQLDVRLVMSHLACADETRHAKNIQQLEVLDTLLPLLPTVAVSLAASDGLMLGKAYHHNLVRPGYALYGGQASQDHIAPVEPVVAAYARVLQVRDVAPGQTVGYSATFVAQRPSKIATIAAGYADGFFRRASAGTNETHGHVAFSGHSAPIAGRVSMDLITADVTDLEEDNPVKRGDWAELIGPTITLEEFGTSAGTIGYEALTRLSHRFHRIYLEQSD